MTMRLIHVLIVASLLAIAAAPVACLLRFGTPSQYDVSPIQFEPTLWKQATSIGNFRTVRNQMVEDLILSKRLDGLPRVEVEQLLGPPLADHAAAGIDAKRWHLAYFLGLERGGAFSLDDEFLVIRLDDEGRAIEYRTVVN